MHTSGHVLSRPKLKARTLIMQSYCDKLLRRSLDERYPSRRDTDRLARSGRRALLPWEEIERSAGGGEDV